MNNLYVVCFDVSDPRRLRRVARVLENFGERVQHSVFECHLNNAQLMELTSAVASCIDPHEDRLAWFSLCPKDVRRARVDGPGAITPNQEFWLW